MKLLAVENAAMEQAIVNWRNWLLSEKSPGTVAAYEWDMRALARRFPTKAPEDFKLPDLTAYQAERRLRGVGDQARKRSACAMRAFFAHMAGKSRSPARTLPIPKPKRKHQRVLDWDQAGAVLATCETSTARGLRDLALLCLMMESALRCAEVCRLELARVNLVTRRLWVVVKGGHEREGSFDQVTAEYLAAWSLARSDFALPGTQTLFCSVGGLTKGAPLTPEGLRSIFRRIGRAASLSAGFSPHDLRRSCATLKTRLGAPSRTVQVGGGWANLKEVETYTADIRLEEFATYSPVSHLLRPEALQGQNVKPGV